MNTELWKSSKSTPEEKIILDLYVFFLSISTISIKPLTISHKLKNPRTECVQNKKYFRFMSASSSSKSSLSTSTRSSTIPSPKKESKSLRASNPWWTSRSSWRGCRRALRCSDVPRRKTTLTITHNSKTCARLTCPLSRLELSGLFVQLWRVRSFVGLIFFTFQSLVHLPCSIPRFG